MYTSDAAAWLLLLSLSDESLESSSSLLTVRLPDGERRGDAECEVQLQPEPPLQRPRARRTTKESMAAVLSLIYADGVARR